MTVSDNCSGVLKVFSLLGVFPFYASFYFDSTTFQKEYCTFYSTTLVTSYLSSAAFFPDSTFGKHKRCCQCRRSVPVSSFHSYKLQIKIVHTNIWCIKCSAGGSSQTYSIPSKSLTLKMSHIKVRRYYQQKVLKYLKEKYS